MMFCSRCSSVSEPCRLIGTNFFIFRLNSMIFSLIFACCLVFSVSVSDGCNGNLLLSWNLTGQTISELRIHKPEHVIMYQNESSFSFRNGQMGFNLWNASFDISHIRCNACWKLYSSALPFMRHKIPVKGLSFFCLWLSRVFGTLDWMNILNATMPHDKRVEILVLWGTI